MGRGESSFDSFFCILTLEESDDRVCIYLHFLVLGRADADDDADGGSIFSSNVSKVIFI